MSNKKESPEEKRWRRTEGSLRAKYRELIGGLILQDILEKNESARNSDKTKADTSGEK